VVNERVREAHQNKFAPMMMLFSRIFSSCIFLGRVIYLNNLVEILVDVGSCETALTYVSSVYSTKIGLYGNNVIALLLYGFYDRIVVVHGYKKGTTTNGDFLLPFKTGAFLSKAPVLPVILRYPYQRFSPAWDSISGVRHVIFLFCQCVNHIEVTRLPVYYPSQQEKDDPKIYADNVRRLMACEGNLILSDIGLAEKRVYHTALNGNNSLPTVLHQKDD
ncbi:unnamed protein product, partial [Ilex paraguariensis]